MNERVLTLYGRAGCSLCDDMAAALRTRLVGWDVTLQRVDIDANPVLKARFDWEVPLLFDGELEIFRHEFDAAALEAWLGEV